MKAVRIISSGNVSIDGDVVFCKLPDVCAFVVGYNRNIVIKNTLVYSNYYKMMPLKIKFLWFWHMVVLRKSHVYLTGANR